MCAWLQSEWDNTDIDRLESEHAILLAEFETKYSEHVRTQQKVARQRKLAREKRLETRLDMEEEMVDSPEGLKSYLKNWMEEESKITAMEKEEDKTKYDVSNMPELKAFRDLSDKLDVLLEEKTFLLQRPRGRHLRRKYKKLYKETKTLVRECEEKLKEAVAVNEKMQKAKGTPKGVLIIAEGDVKRAEAALERATSDNRCVYVLESRLICNSNLLYALTCQTVST